MLNDLKDAFTRSVPTLAEDAVGAMALVVMLMAGLILPAVL